MINTPDQSVSILGYIDRKRYLWMLSTLWPATPMIGLWLVAQTGWTIWYALVLIVWYAMVPLLDAMFGEDFNNPPEEAV
ncbi:hypothetical protein WAC39_27975, partial [Klebsiella pneumoniae]